MISGKYSRAGRPGLAQLVDTEGKIVEHHGHTGQYLQQHRPGHLSSHTNQTSPTPTITKHPDTDPDRGHNVHQSPNFRQSMQRIISWLGHRCSLIENWTQKRLYVAHIRVKSDY